MSVERYNQTESELSFKRASEMFSTLFEDPKNSDAAKSLFEWLPGLARQQQIEKTIRSAQWWLKELKNNIV